VFKTNERTFRGFAKSDMESPSYSAAFSALVRIKPPHVHRYVPVTKESLEIAFAVSPEFARTEAGAGRRNRHRVAHREHSRHRVAG
jgi:hypothetical protein